MRLRFISEPQVAFRRQSGMTLVEILVASAISAIVITVVMTLTIFATRSVKAMTNYTELDQASRNTLDLLTRDIRQASKLDVFAANKIVLRNPLPDNSTCTYLYTAGANGTLVRSNSSGVQVLLKGCDSLTFKISNRYPSNDFMFYSATKDTAKLIDVSWKCSRKIKGEKLNTESIQTAKIVMRN